MSFLSDWWTHQVVEHHKGPLLLTLVAFIATFVVTRTITRLIRAGRGPFKNISHGNVHIHHSTPGIVLLIIGALVAIGSPPNSIFTYPAAAFIGIGVSLVLDEFAMLLYLRDVYWAKQGQLSVNVVTLCAACIGLVVVGVSPISTSDLGAHERYAREVVIIGLILHFLLVGVCGLKGKFPTAVVGIFAAPISWFGALRIARPGSLWERWFYDDAKHTKAAKRAAEFDSRWGPIHTKWNDFIGGSPTTPPLNASETPTNTQN